MAGQSDAKRERVIEAVRKGLEGDAALAFIRQSGFAMTQAGIARHLRALGGTGKVAQSIKTGQSNTEILAANEPPRKPSRTPAEPDRQARALSDDELFPTKKLTLQLPSELLEAVRAAAKSTGLSQNQVIVDVLNRGLSRMPARETEEQQT